MGIGNFAFKMASPSEFRSNLENETKVILDILKPGLNPEVFLVAVRIAPDAKKEPICIEAQLDHWSQNSKLAKAIGDVRSIRSSYPEAKLTSSLPDVQRIHEYNLFCRALRDAVKRRLEDTESFPGDTCVYLAWPYECNSYLVFIAVTLKKSVLEKIPSLLPAHVNITQNRTYPVPISFAEAVIEEILARARKEGAKNDSDSPWANLGDHPELVRKSGVTFFNGLLLRVEGGRTALGGSTGVFNALNRLSLTAYERADAQGRLIFGSVDPGTENLILNPPLPIREPRVLRKLLALTDDEFALRCNHKNAISIVRAPACEAQQRAIAVEIAVVGRGKWVSSVEGRDLLIMTDGQPSLPKAVVDEAELAKDLRRIIKSMTEANALRFAKIGHHLANSGHGALLVVTEDAARESIRLGNESLPIKPAELNPKMAARLSRIDGV